MESLAISFYALSSFSCVRFWSRIPASVRFIGTTVIEALAVGSSYTTSPPEMMENTRGSSTVVVVLSSVLDELVELVELVELSVELLELDESALELLELEELELSSVLESAVDRTAFS